MIVLLSLSALALFPAQAQEQKPAKAKDAMVCKYQARTGTRFRTKTCRTRSNWDEMEEAARLQAQEELNKPTISIERGN